MFGWIDSVGLNNKISARKKQCLPVLQGNPNTKKQSVGGENPDRDDSSLSTIYCSQ